MRIRLSLATALLVLAGCCGGALAADPSGTWLTQGGNSRVRIADCGGALCGTIVWLNIYPLDPPAMVSRGWGNPAFTNGSQAMNPVLGCARA